MYAIVKTGGKQYKVCAGDKLVIEKVPAEVGDKIKLDAICIVDDGKVETDAAKAAATTIEAEVLEQFKDKKKIVFKFKKRKNYQRKRGHRQQLTKVRILSVGTDKYEPPKAAEKPAAKSAKSSDDAKAAKPAKAAAEKAEDKPAKAAKASTAKPAAKTASKAKASSTKSAAKDSDAAKKPAAKTTKKADAASDDKAAKAPAE